MARINTNVPSVIAQANFARTQAELNVRLERLSTGLRINRGKDDPAGLIISERIRSDLNGVEQGMKNAQRASSMISTTEGALTEVNDLLNSIRSLIVQSANAGAISADERAANQLQIDSAIDSITRISNTASFGGLKLLNGSLDYTLSGVRNSAITSVHVNNASFVNQAAVSVSVDVVASAQKGALFYQGGTPPGYTLSAMTLEIQGTKGVQTITIASGQQPLQNVVNAVNRLKDFTGVEAAIINGDPASGMVFRSTDYGTDAFVSVKRVDKPQNPALDSWILYKLDNNAPVPGGVPFPWSTFIGNGTLVTGERDGGQDVSALVNGNLANGKGLNLLVSSASLGLNMTLTEALATQPGATPSTFAITGGGALFQLGPEVTVLQQTGIGISSAAASKLGGTLINGTVEFLNSLKQGQSNSIDACVRRGNDFTAAQDILGKAIDDITVMRGRLGAFERNVLDTNVRSLQAQFENLTASGSAIRDADFAVETSLLTRAQILASAGTSTLALANSQSQQVLQLLR